MTLRMFKSLLSKAYLRSIFILKKIDWSFTNFFRLLKWCLIFFLKCHLNTFFLGKPLAVSESCEKFSRKLLPSQGVINKTKYLRDFIGWILENSYLTRAHRNKRLEM